MKAIFLAIYPIFLISALITHIWTVIIAFQEGGIIMAIVSLLLPVVSEIYWMYQMFGVNDTYAWIALLHLLLAVPVGLFRTTAY